MASSPYNKKYYLIMEDNDSPYKVYYKTKKEAQKYAYLSSDGKVYTYKNINFDELVRKYASSEEFELRYSCFMREVYKDFLKNHGICEKELPLGLFIVFCENREN